MKASTSLAMSIASLLLLGGLIVYGPRFLVDHAPALPSTCIIGAVFPSRRESMQQYAQSTYVCTGMNHWEQLSESPRHAMDNTPALPIITSITLPYAICEAEGTPNSYRCTTRSSSQPTPVTYGTHRQYVMRIDQANMGEVTLNLDGLGPRPLLKITDSQPAPLATRDLVSEQLIGVLDGEEAFYLCPIGINVLATLPAWNVPWCR